MTKEVLTVARNPSGSVYRALIDWCMPRSEEVLVIMRATVPVEDTALRIVDELVPHLMREERAKEWPGTRLLFEDARVLHMHPSDTLGALLKRRAHALFDWQHPSHPEDLCFVSSNRRVLLTSIAHEGEAFMQLTPDEVADVLKEVPGLVLTPGYEHKGKPPEPD